MRFNLLLKVSIGISISIVFLYFLLINIDINQILLTFQKADLFYIPFIFIFYLTSFAFRTLRWKIILKNVPDKKNSNLFSILIIGFGFNNILPLRLGELIRSYILKIKYKLSFVYALSTIFFEKIMDAIILIIFAFLVIIFFPIPQWIESLSIIAAFIFSILIFLYVILSFRGDWLLTKIKDKKYISRLSNPLSKIIESSHVLRGKGQIYVLVLSFLTWVMEFLAFYFTALTLKLPIPLYVLILVMIVINIGIMIPSAPGYIGTFEAFAVLTLVAFGFSNSVAFSYAILIHAIQFVSITLLTILFIFTYKISIKEILSMDVKKSE